MRSTPPVRSIVRKSGARLLPGAAAALLWLCGKGASVETPTGEGANFDAVMMPFLAEHCVRCHGEKKQKGELRLGTLARDFGSPLSAAHWADVMERISAREMPPKDEAQPGAEDAARVAGWIAQQLKEGEATRLAKRDRVTFHKLTREEYANTIRDLLGVNFDATDPGGLPEDPGWQERNSQGPAGYMSLPSCRGA